MRVKIDAFYYVFYVDDCNPQIPLPLTHKDLENHNIDLDASIEKAKKYEPETILYDLAQTGWCYGNYPDKQVVKEKKELRTW